MTLTDDQAKAVKKGIDYILNYKLNTSRPFIISGIAGSGKTYTVRHLINEMGIPDEKVAFVAYTGKAVDVLNQSGVPAKTIHSCFYYCKTVEEEIKKGKDKGKIIRKFVTTFNPETRDMYSLIVIDEVSMVTDDIFMDLMSLGLPIIGLGDHNQLPPVGHSQCHEFVLNPDVRFDKSIRHGDGNYILTLAEEVLKSPYLRTGLYGKNVKIVKFATKEYYTHADQIICCTNKMRNIISRKMRFDKDIDADAYPLPLAGEKIISKINDWGQTIFSENGWGTINLINGLVGYCIGDFNSYTNTLTFMPYYHKVIAFENIKVDHMTFVEDNVNLDKELLFKNLYEHGLHTFEYAYALTVHSSQGSEFDDVVVFAKDIWGNTDMRKKMLYTAITRAKKNLTLII